MLDNDVELEDDVTKEGSSAENVLGLLECHRVVRHVHSRFGITEEQRGVVELQNAQVVEERAEEKYLLCSQRGAEVFGLST